MQLTVDGLPNFLVPSFLRAVCWLQKTGLEMLYSSAAIEKRCKVQLLHGGREKRSTRKGQIQ